MFYGSIDNECKKFCYESNISTFEETHELHGNHLEADTRVMFHVNQADQEGNGNNIGRGNDTDIATITLSFNIDMLNQHVDYNNSCEYLDMKNSKGFTYVQDLQKRQS